jgi:hypothetical protein
VVADDGPPSVAVVEVPPVIPESQRVEDIPPEPTFHPITKQKSTSLHVNYIDVISELKIMQEQ